MSSAILEGRKILITGPAGQIAFPLARELARRNEVWGIARFGDPKSRREVEEAGIRTLPIDLGRPDFSSLPRDFTHLLHLAAAIHGDDYDGAIRVNAEGTGLLLSHCREVEAVPVELLSDFADRFVEAGANPFVGRRILHVAFIK